MVSALGLSACGNSEQSNRPVTEANTPESETEQAETIIPTDNYSNTEVASEMTTIQVIIKGQEFEAKLNDDEAAKAVYRNATPAIRNSGIPREEIFVITKLSPNQFANAEATIDEALEKLEEFLPQITITPALVQNEIHPYYQENDVIPYIQSLGIVVQGWYPLGSRGHTAELLNNEVISEIAASHGKSFDKKLLTIWGDYCNIPDNLRLNSIISKAFKHKIKTFIPLSPHIQICAAPQIGNTKSNIPFSTS